MKILQLPASILARLNPWSIVKGGVEWEIFTGRSPPPYRLAMAARLRQAAWLLFLRVQGSQGLAQSGYFCRRLQAKAF